MGESVELRRNNEEETPPPFPRYSNRSSQRMLSFIKQQMIEPDGNNQEEQSDGVKLATFEELQQHFKDSDNKQPPKTPPDTTINTDTTNPVTTNADLINPDLINPDAIEETTFEDVFDNDVEYKDSPKTPDTISSNTIDEFEFVEEENNSPEEERNNGFVLLQERTTPEGYPVEEITHGNVEHEQLMEDVFRETEDVPSAKPEVVNVQVKTVEGTRLEVVEEEEPGRGSLQDGHHEETTDGVLETVAQKAGTAIDDEQRKFSGVAQSVLSAAPILEGKTGVHQSDNKIKVDEEQVFESERGSSAPKGSEEVAEEKQLKRGKSFRKKVASFFKPLRLKTKKKKNQ